MTKDTVKTLDFNAVSDTLHITLNHVALLLSMPVCSAVD